MTAPAVAQNARLGVWLMIGAALVFAAQDGLSRHLAGQYNVLMVVMIRYWFFAVFVIWFVARKTGGLRAALRTAHPVLQPFRGVLLAVQICVMVEGFVRLGLVGNHAIFAFNPLLIAAFSGPVLGEKVGWRRWVAIGAGFAGVLIILQPGAAVFSTDMLLSLLAASMFAFYALTTRYVGRRDPALVSFFWLGVMGAVVMTVIGLPHWQAMSAVDSGWMALLCVFGVFAHYLLIRAYEVAEAAAIQPFSYLQLVFASLLGIVIFGEVLQPHVALGAAVVIGAGLFTLWRQRISGA